MPGLKIYSEYGSIFPVPETVRGKAVFATFSPERLNEVNISGKLYQSALLFKNYPGDVIFPEGIERKRWNILKYRQRNIAVNYPYFRARKYFTIGMPEEGLKELQKAAKLGREIPWLLNNIGRY